MEREQGAIKIKYMKKENHIIRIIYGNGDIILKEYKTRKGADKEFHRLNKGGPIYNSKIGFTKDFIIKRK